MKAKFPKNCSLLDLCCYKIIDEIEVFDDSFVNNVPNYLKEYILEILSSHLYASVHHLNLLISSNMKEIHISRYCKKVTNEHILAVVNRANEKLETLSIGYSSDNSSITDDSIIAVTKKFHMLTNLEISNSPITDNVIEHIAIGCPLLEIFDISDCKEITSISKLLLRCPLREVFISYCEKFKLVALADIICLPTMQTVFANHCGQYDEKLVNFGIQKQPSSMLCELNLSNCQIVTSAFIYSIFNMKYHFPHLQELNLNLDIKGMNSILFSIFNDRTYFPKLTTLKLPKPPITFF